VVFLGFGKGLGWLLCRCIIDRLCVCVSCLVCLLELVMIVVIVSII